MRNYCLSYLVSSSRIRPGSINCSDISNQSLLPSKSLSLMNVYVSFLTFLIFCCCLTSEIPRLRSTISSIHRPSYGRSCLPRMASSLTAMLSRRGSGGTKTKCVVVFLLQVFRIVRSYVCVLCSPFSKKSQCVVTNYVAIKSFRQSGDMLCVCNKS